MNTKTKICQKIKVKICETEKYVKNAKICKKTRLAEEISDQAEEETKESLERQKRRRGIEGRDVRIGEETKKT